MSIIIYFYNTELTLFTIYLAVDNLLNRYPFFLFVSHTMIRKLNIFDLDYL